MQRQRFVGDLDIHEMQHSLGECGLRACTDAARTTPATPAHHVDHVLDRVEALVIMLVPAQNQVHTVVLEDGDEPRLKVEVSTMLTGRERWAVTEHDLPGL